MIYKTLDIKNIIFPFLLFCIFKSSAQDSIVNYLDRKKNKTKKSNAFFVETLVKKNDLWFHTLYHRNRKIKKRGQYLKKNKSLPIGNFYNFFRSGDLKRIYTYNDISQLDGYTKAWFPRNKLNYIGNYENGSKAGIWKYYHVNGKIACKQYFQNTKIIKTVIFDENGIKIEKDLIESREPEFEGGGIDKFFKHIRRIHENIDFQINGIIYVNFDVNAEGVINNVSIDDNIPIKLKRKLILYFESIEGWSPAIHMNRKIPYYFSLPLDFRVLIEER